VVLGVLISLALVAASLLLGWRLRDHTLSSLQVVEAGDHALLFLAPLDAADRTAAAAALLPHLGATPRLAYIAPATWSIPELGLLASATYANDGVQEVGRPTTHGNAGGYGSHPFRVLITAPQPAGATGRNLLRAAVRIRPVASLSLEPATGAVYGRADAGPSLWPGIPVPLY
jgi:hypothetical protein